MQISSLFTRNVLEAITTHVTAMALVAILMGHVLVLSTGKVTLCVAHVPLDIQVLSAAVGHHLYISGSWISVYILCQ